MEARIKHIKKKDLNSPPSPVEAPDTANARESSKIVKSWVKEFQEDRRDGNEPLGTFDGLFGDSKA